MAVTSCTRPFETMPKRSLSKRQMRIEPFLPPAARLRRCGQTRHLYSVARNYRPVRCGRKVEGRINMLLNRYIGLISLGLGLALSPSLAQEPFYKGKRINVLINFDAGPAPDIEGRVFA